MIRLFVLILSYGLLSINTKAQTTQTDSSKHRTVVELGMNVTSTLSSFLGSGTNPSTDPYLVSLKIAKDKQATRLAFDVGVSNKSENDPNNTGGTRDTYEYNIGLKAGHERRVPIGKGFGFYWGVDAILGYQKSKVSFFSQFGQVTTGTDNYTAGISPLVGFRYDLNRHIAFSTEGSLVGTYHLSREKIDDSVSLFPTIETKRFNMNTVMPSAFYLIIKF